MLRFKGFRESMEIALRYVAFVPHIAITPRCNPLDFNILVEAKPDSGRTRRSRDSASRHDRPRSIACRRHLGRVFPPPPFRRGEGSRRDRGTHLCRAALSRVARLVAGADGAEPGPAWPHPSPGGAGA